MQEVLATLWKKFVKKHLFHEDGSRLDDRTFMRRIAVAIGSIVLCMSAMGFTAYAYFTSSITSSSNIIQAASYSTEIAVKDASGVEITPKVDNIDYIYGLGSGTYSVTIKALGNATTGYCKIVVGDVNAETSVKYYTTPMSPDEQQLNNILTFTIQCYESSDIHIITNWGSCSETDEAKIVASGETISIGTPSIENSAETLTESTTETPTQTQTPSEKSEEDGVSSEESGKATNGAASSDTSAEPTPDNPTEESADGSNGGENGGEEDTTVLDENISE